MDSRPRKKYRCRHCARTFARNEHCSRHERTHTRERPFACRICHKTYGRKDLVKRHEETIHVDRRESLEPGTSKPLCDNKKRSTSDSASHVSQWTEDPNSTDFCSIAFQPPENGPLVHMEDSAAMYALNEPQESFPDFAIDPALESVQPWMSQKHTRSNIASPSSVAIGDGRSWQAYDPVVPVLKTPWKRCWTKLVAATCDRYVQSRPICFARH